MVAAGGLLDTDPYAYTTAGRPFLNFEWGFDLAAWGVYALAGIPGILVARVALVGAILLLVARHAGTLAGTGRSALLARAVAAAAIIAALPVLRIRLVERPHLVGYLLLIVHLAGAVSLSRARDRAHAMRVGVPLVLTMPIWAAFHGSWPLAFVIWGAHFLWDRGVRRRFVAVGLAGLILTTLNPYGPGLLLVPLRHIGGAEVSRWVTEWMPPEHSLPVAHAAVAGALFGLFALSAALRRRRDDAADVMVALAMMVLAARSFRFVAPAILVVIPPLAARLGAALAAARGPGRARVALVGLAVVAGLLYATLIDQERQSFPRSLEWHTVGLPRSAAETILRHDLPGPVVNDFDAGDDLCWTLGSKVRHVIDGRVDLFGPTQLRDYVAMLQTPGALDDHVAEHDVQLVLLGYGAPRNAPLIAHLMRHPELRLIHLDESYALWARGRALERARARGLVLRRVRPAAHVELMIAGAPDAESRREVEQVATVSRPPLGDVLRTELAWRAARADPTEPRLRAVTEHADRALARRSDLAHVRLRRGQARLRLGDATGATFDLLGAGSGAAPGSARRDLAKAISSLHPAVRGAFIGPLLPSPASPAR